MKLLTQFGLCCLLAPGLFAGQHAAAGSGGHAGGGRVAGVRSSHNAGRAHASIRTFGYRGYGGYGYGGFYGGYEPLSDYGYAPSVGAGGSGMTVVYPPSPPAVMVTEPVHSVIHEYNQPGDYGQPPSGEGNPILYLIAFRDSTIRAATTYWVEDGTLHYLDPAHKSREAPLSSVDRDLSAQLNRERRVPFNLQ